MVLISHSYPPVVGGSEMEVQRVCATLRSRGHRVHVVCAGGEPMPKISEWVDPYGTPVRIIGNGVASAEWRARVFAAGVVWFLIRKSGDARIAYFLMQGLQVLVGVPVARLLGMRVVMKFSGSGEIRRLRESWLGRVELLCLRKLAHRIMVLNAGMMKEAADAGFAVSRLIWMPNPVDTEEFRPCEQAQRLALRRAAGLPFTAPVVVFVGRLAPEKMLTSLIDAFRITVRRHPDAVLVLVGDGPSRGELTARADNLGLGSNVRFAGMVDSRLVRQWLQLSDVLALISPLEGFSCALIEAMATGLPAVVSDIPANTQLIEDGVHGLVVRPGDEEAIAAALSRLLEDRQLRSRLGKAARERVASDYSTEKVIARYEALLEELESGQRRGRPSRAP
jgi:glycosyltransferase involved in cell wall biosynthesis